jgi:hypothetical protein
MKTTKVASPPRTSTLTSLAILKVDIDEGNRDYVDYLAGFVIEALAIRRPEIASETNVVQFLDDEFGFRIPMKAVQTVLRRIAKSTKYLVLRDRAYFTTSALPKPAMAIRRTAAEQQIQTVIEGLCQFSQKIGVNPPWTHEKATSAILSFLSRFAIDCLRTHVFNTVLPQVPESGVIEHYVVGKFVRDAHSANRELFNSFIVLVKGQMYANALTCPDLQSLDKKFRTLTCYLDTPVILDLLGLHGKAFEAATKELVELVTDLTGSVHVFQHTFEEVLNVLRFAIDHYDDLRASNRILRELRATNEPKSDLILTAGNLEERLKSLKVRVVETPLYAEKYQVDEEALRVALLDEIGYLGESALSFDVNSVRSVYVKRKGTTPVRLEDAVAVLVTSNSRFAKAAYDTGKSHNSSREVSPVITDYSLANVSWLKSPLKRPTMPEKETLALCYAGMEPSPALFEKYVSTMDSMHKRGMISEDDHALLRASGVAQSDLMNLTMGDDEALTEKSISKILADTKEALVADLTAIHNKREAASEQKRELALYTLNEERARRQADKARIQRMANGVARGVFLAPFVVVSVLLLMGAFMSSGLVTLDNLAISDNAKFALRAMVVLAVILGWWSLLTGTSVRAMLQTREKTLAAFILRSLMPD